MEEVWKPIINYEELYEVSNSGFIKSLPKSWYNQFGAKITSKGKILNTKIAPRCKSASVSLLKGGKYKNFLVKDLVGKHFLIPTENPTLKIIYINPDNCIDNSVNNLIWGRRDTKSVLIKKIITTFIKDNTPIELLVKNISGIYKIINKCNNKFYIGSSKNILYRLNNHFKMLRLNNHHCSKLQRSYNKYGEGCFQIEIIEECNIDDLEIREQFFCDKLKPFFNTAKIRRKGYDKHSETTKSKIRNAIKKYYSNMSKEDRVSHAIKIAKKCYETRLSKGISKTITLQIDRTNFNKKQLSNSKNKSKIVLQYDINGKFITEWDSVAKAMGEIGGGNISNCCRGNQVTANGFIWKYKN